MLDEQDGAVVVADAVDQLAQLYLLGGVHAGGGLIERDQLRVGGESPGNFQAALVAVAQGPRLVVGKLADAHVVEQLLRALGDGGFFRLEALGAQHGAQQTRLGTDVAAHHHVFQRRHFCKQAYVLEGAGNARLGHFMHGRGLVGLAGQLEAAAVGRVQAGDHVEKGGLARAVGSDQAIHLAPFDGDAHVGQCLQAAKALGDAGNPQHHIFVLFCHVFALCGVQVFCVRLLPRSGAGHKPRGRNSMMMIMASAISSWRRMAESMRPSVMACSGPAT